MYGFGFEDLSFAPNISTSGYMTPMTPIPLDLPSMNPSVNMLESVPKRQRTWSTFGDDFGLKSTCSNDVDERDADFQQMWDSLEPDTNIIIHDQLDAVPTAFATPPTSGRATRKKNSSPRRSSDRMHPYSISPRPSSEKTRSMPRKLRNPPKSPSPQLPRTTLPAVMVRCSPEKRKEKVARYLEKRKRRVWKKEIKYSCRKQFAESRPRVAGRFIPKPSKLSLDALPSEVYANVLGQA